MTEKIRAVQVDNHGQEYHEVGKVGVTSIEWGSMNGLHCDLPTVVVFKDGSRWSEHPFANVSGVYYYEVSNDE
jgi:hypothetical protein